MEEAHYREETYEVEICLFWHDWGVFLQELYVVEHPHIAVLFYLVRM